MALCSATTILTGVLTLIVVLQTSAAALGFTTPLLLTVLGSVMLRERFSAGRWLGSAAGFAGMLLIVRPGTSMALPGILASLGAAATYAVYQALVRRLREVASSLDSAMQVGLVGVVLLTGAMGVFWRQLSAETFGVVVAFTAVQTAALASLAAGLRRSEASRLAPWQFSGLLWAMALDMLLFGGQPSSDSLLGGTLIIVGGLLAQAGARR